MKKSIITLALAVVACMAWAAPRAITPQGFADYVQNVNRRALNTDSRWNKGTIDAQNSRLRAPQQQVITSSESAIDDASFWGTLYTPDGKEWMYCAVYEYETVEEYEMASIKGAEIKIYDDKLKVYSTFTTSFQLEGNQTSINFVELNPVLTRKFFNIDDALEVMVYVHATTDDYVGVEYTNVYSLKTGELITTIEGNNVMSLNTAPDPWSERYNLVFMRESFSEIPSEDPEGKSDYSYMLYFDVYSRAGWGTPCQLDHTFEIDYTTVAGAGNAALPILMSATNNKLRFALPRYEKPYFADDWSDDITPDNHFIIDLYDENFTLIKTTSIPMTLEGEAMFSFPGMGELYGADDLSYGVFNDDPDNPVYIIGMENYVRSIDDFYTSLYVYDTDGNRIHTIADNCSDYMLMSNINDQEEQWCFYYSNEDGGYFSFVDVPSCVERARVNILLNQEAGLSASLDRVQFGQSYRYVSSLSTANVNDNGDVIHRFAWFDDKGHFLRFDGINLGDKVTLAQPYVRAEALNPYLFNTDKHIEYMFLVKELVDDTSTRGIERLKIYSENSELLLDLGPIDELGQTLNSIFLFNVNETNPKLIVTYSDRESYWIHSIDLPFSSFSGGDGTAQSPYQISTPGDMMNMYLHPSANYVLTNDIDFEYFDWSGNMCTFSGKLDGCGYTISNLSLRDNGLFSLLFNRAEIRNINFVNPVVNYSGSGSCGILACEAMSDSGHPTIDNVVIWGLRATGDATGNFGALIGRPSVRTSISNISVIDADIEMPGATVGAVAGLMSTGVIINNCYVTGKIAGRTVGGIVGESFTGDETIDNCHVDANLVGSRCVGGIIGESGRTIIKHCLVEGGLEGTSAGSEVGGIAGHIKPVYNETDPVIIVEGCITAADITAADGAIAHRIAGWTSIDEKVIDWDTKDPNFDPNDPSTYRYLPSSPEKDLRGNYALGVDVIDAEIADDADSTEGRTITEAELTDEFFATGGWMMGSTDDAPWQRGGNIVVLYFEEAVITGVTDVIAPAGKIIFDGATLKADNALIEVYNMQGMLVASARGNLSTKALTPGIYVARAGQATVKFVIK